MTHSNSEIEQTTTNFDAEQLVDEIEAGEESMPSVNVSDDYERSKLYSQPSISAEEGEQDISATVPSEFIEMAKTIQPDEEA